MELDSLFANSLDRFASRPCLVCPRQGQRTYGEVIEEAGRFQTRLPVTKQLVFIEARNSIASIVSYLGALRGGHAAHLLDPDKEDDNAALLATYDPNVLVRCTQENYSVEQRHDRDLRIHPELAILLSTSGSTGSKKFVKLSSLNIQSNTQSIVEYLGMEA